MRKTGLVWTLALALSMTACGDDDDDDDDMADASAGTPDGSAGTPDAPAGTPDASPGTPDAAASDAAASDGSVLDASPPDASPPDASPPDASPPDASPPDAGSSPDAFPPTTYNGIVFIAEASGGVFDPPQSSAFAGFTTGEVWGTPLGSFGDCTAYDGVVTDSYNAGTITVSGANLDPLVITPSGAEPNIVYDATVTPPLDLIDPGDVLDFAATGATIPSFTGSVTVPGEVLGYMTPGTVDRSAAFPVTWTAGSADLVWVTVQSIDSGGTDARIVVCPTADDGAYTVPQEAVALLATTHDIAISLIYRVNETPLFLTTATVNLTGSHVVGTDILAYVP